MYLYFLCVCGIKAVSEVGFFFYKAPKAVFSCILRAHHPLALKDLMGLLTKAR